MCIMISHFREKVKLKLIFSNKYVTMKTVEKEERIRLLSEAAVGYDNANQSLEGKMKLEIRLNEIRVASLKDFCQLENRYYNGSKPTSFVLQTGVDSQEEFLKELQQTDEALADLDRSAKNWYYRTGLLEAFMEKEKQEELQGISENILGGRSFPQRFENSIWESAYQEGAEKILAEYKTQEKAENRIKNFLVLLLYRIEYYFPKLFKNTKTLSKFPKFVYTGTCGTPEYYFLRLLSFCGCDVYCVHPQKGLHIKAVDWEKNVQWIEKNLELQGKIPAYDIEQIRRKKMQRSSGTPVNQPMIRVAESAAPPAGSACQSQPAPVNLTRPGRNPMGTTNTSLPGSSVPSEKSYEELAGMAGSVVMIVVFDKDKKPFASGSGVLINKDGYILTNFHVVQDAVAYGVKLEEEQELRMTNELIKYHPDNDLALIRIEPVDRPPIPVHQEGKLVRGQRVVAIGSPLGLFNTVSDGIIAGFRQLDDVSMIQFTAPTSHGSSGGALLNLQGELIGVVSAGYDDGENLNLAVDFQVVRSFLHGFL